MFQDSTNVGVEAQLSSTTVFSANYVHNKLTRTIEDFSALINGDNVYEIGNPGEGIATIYPAAYPATPNFPMPKPKRQYDALELSVSRRFSKNWFVQRELHAEPAVRQLLRSGGFRRDSDAHDRRQRRHDAAVRRQHRPCRQQLALGLGHRLDSVGFARQPRRATAVCRPIGRTSLKLYGAYTLPFGTQFGAFFYAGQRHADLHRRHRRISSNRCS